MSFYEKPSVDITYLTVCDVITTSGAYTPPDSGGPDFSESAGGDSDLPWDN